MLEGRHLPFSKRPRTRFSRVSSVLALVLGLSCFFAPALVHAQSHHFPAGMGRSEAGFPLFSISSQEEIGLDAPPTDIHLLPDGRLAVLSGNQIAFGDGVRWTTFSMVHSEILPNMSKMAMDQDGSLYMASNQGFAKVILNERGEWSLMPVTSWLRSPLNGAPVIQSVYSDSNDWLWFGDSGPIYRWRPAAELSVLGSVNTIETVFHFQGKAYISERSQGLLYRHDGNSLTRLQIQGALSVSDTITCAAPFGPDMMLVGTDGHGLKVFDGVSLRDFAVGSMSSKLRINDLQTLEGGYYVAAFEGRGLALLNGRGELLQILEKSLDHRLSSIRKIITTRTGLVWGLTDQGIVRAAMPSRVSHFEPYFDSGLTTAHPYRLNNQLWFMADGKIQKALYDDTGRFTSIQIDSPGDLFAFAFDCSAGVPIVGTEKGSFYRGPEGWVLFDKDAVNMRLLTTKPLNGRWVFGAENRVGWFHLEQGKPVLDEVYETPGVGPLFNVETDVDGDIFIEQGSSRLSCVHLENGKPTVTTYDGSNGLPDGWAQLFRFENELYVNIGGKILKPDKAGHRFVEEPSFTEKFPGVDGIVGRPGLDAQGRAWISARDRVMVFEKSNNRWNPVALEMPVGFSPYFFTFEEGGVVWMHSRHHLARFDPNFPAPSPTPYRAIITHVRFPTTERSLEPSDFRLPDLPYSENSIVINFLVPNSPLSSSVMFEFKLEGADGTWIPAGSSGTASFNQLKEGHYLFKVRPIVAGETGDGASLEFTIRPPWFRSGGAYSVYFLVISGILFASGRFASLLQRRENARLEHLVAQRTRELNETNDRLEAQVEEISLLNQAIEQSPVAVYIALPDGLLVFANPRACELCGYKLSELIGQRSTVLRAETVAPEILSLISSTVGQGKVWRGQLRNKTKDGQFIDVRSIVVPIRSTDNKIRHHLILEEDITASVQEQEQRRRLEMQLFQAQKLESLGTLAGGIAHDFNNILTGILGFCELARLSAGDRDAVNRDLDEVSSAGLRAKDLVAQILTFSRQTTTNLQVLDLGSPVTEALKLVRASTPSTISITSHLESTMVRADKTQMQQIVLNLCTNAVHAIKDKNGRVHVELKAFTVDSALLAEIPSLHPGEYARLQVSDDGCGMDPAILDRIFDPFFTTKDLGEGTGLGLSIVQGIVTSHHGGYRVKSTVGIGTQFEIYLPISNEIIPSSRTEPPIPRGSNQTVLVVDDEKTIASFISAKLNKLGYRTEVFLDSRQALASVKARPEHFQAIVTDLTMPGLTGADLIAQVRELGCDIPAIVVTGYGRDAVRAKIESLKNVTVLPKPFGGDELARAISETLPQRQ